MQASPSVLDLNAQKQPFCEILQNGCDFTRAAPDPTD